MQHLRLIAVLYVSAMLFGMNVGIQGIVTTISTRGVFGDACSAQSDRNSTGSSDGLHVAPTFVSNDMSTTAAGLPQDGEDTLPCLAQEKRIAAVINVMLSLTNLVSLPNGFLIDAFGAEPVTIAAVGTWVIAIAVSGIAPGNGILWSIALCSMGWANSAAFMAFSTFHLREACENDKGNFAFWSTVSMAFRAVGALASIPMSEFLNIRGLDLWTLYVIWGACIGLPALIVFVVLYKQGQRKREAEARAEDISVEKPSSGDKLKKAVVDFKAASATLAFWSLTLRLSVLVVFGSIFIANLGAIARYHGATQSDIAVVRQHFTYILGGLGVSNPLPGFLIKKVGTRPGIGAVSGLCLAFLIVCVCGTLHDKGKFTWFFEVGFVAFALWRYWSYSVCALYIPTVFPDRSAGYGLIFGACGAVAGGLSVAIGGFVTHQIQNDPEKLPVVVGVFAALGVIAELVAMYTMATLVPRPPASEGQALIPSVQQPEPSEVDEPAAPPQFVDSVGTA